MRRKRFKTEGAVSSRFGRDSRFSTTQVSFFLFFHPVQKVQDEKREKQMLSGGE
jgi:hypothetical protein